MTMFGIDALLNIGGKLIDKLIPDPEAKAQAQLKLAELAQNGELKQLDADIAEQKELTERLKADMASDSWLSKNIRPMSLIALFCAYVFFAILSAFEIETRGAYVELLGQWGQLAFGFYFSSRGLEKLAQIKYKNEGKE